MSQGNGGQSTLEYAVIIAVAAAALVAMQFYMKRGVQGKLRDATDQIGQQYRAGKTTSEYTFDTHSTRQDVLLENGSSTSTLDGDETQTRSGFETVDTTGEKTVFEELEEEETPPVGP
ncbi:MAG: hypothetical protein Q8R91_07485 [Candidatus Omnitrophota bacterium]|nr:hypothetical protein [Candidatus Omnitrophota bacterium]